MTFSMASVVVRDENAYVVLVLGGAISGCEYILGIVDRLRAHATKAVGESAGKQQWKNNQYEPSAHEEARVVLEEAPQKRL